jgi:hypothetical protein
MIECIPLIIENTLNKQSRTAGKEWSSSWGLDVGQNNSSPKKCSLLRNVTQGLGLGRILWSMGEKNAYRDLVGNPEEKRPLGRPRRRREDNIKMDIREIGWGGMD